LASAAVVAATEMARTRLAAGRPTSGGNRNVISSVLLRADEPGELLGYWFRRYARSVPHPIRNGLADAAQNLYDEKALAAYDHGAQQVRFADVISLVHPEAATRDQEELFHYVIARRENGSPIPASLAMLRARADLHAVAPQQRQELLDRPDAAQALAVAGMTYGMLDRWLLSGMDARAWAAMRASASAAAARRRPHGSLTALGTGPGAGDGGRAGAGARTARPDADPHRPVRLDVHPGRPGIGRHRCRPGHGVRHGSRARLTDATEGLEGVLLCLRRRRAVCR
jgi:hypothetical protein